MGYPHGETYLEQIQRCKREADSIRRAFWTLRKKYIADHPDKDELSLSLKEEFAILGEAFELESVTLDGAVDLYHFMWDVLDELLPEAEGEG